MKPLGIRLEISPETGLPHMYCPRISHTEDALWEAVETALDEGWTPARFAAETRQAWNHYADEKKRDLMEEISKAFP